MKMFILVLIIESMEGITSQSIPGFISREDCSNAGRVAGEELFKGIKIRRLQFMCLPQTQNK